MSAKTFTSTTFNTISGFVAAAQAGTVEVVRATAADKLVDVAYTCATDTYPNAVTVIRINRAAARRLGLEVAA